MNAFGMLTASTLIMLPVVFWIDGTPLLVLSLPVWAALLAVAIFSTAIAYLLYFNTLKHAGATNLMLVTILIPPIAVALSFIFLDKKLSGDAWIGFGLIASGLLVATLQIRPALSCRRSGL